MCLTGVATDAFLRARSSVSRNVHHRDRAGDRMPTACRPHADRDAHQVLPTHEPQLAGVGRIAPFRAGGRHASRGAFDPISGPEVSIM